MEDKIIYAVSSGCYSDYRIDALFDNIELAQKFINSFKEIRDFNDVEEYDLNPLENEIKNGYTPYFIRMDKIGNCTEIKAMDNTYNCFSDRVGYCIKGEMYTHIWAKDEKHAIKICNERRINEISLNRFE